jgi:hypothetical protein
MRPKWTTTRWRLPRSVREEQYSQVFAKEAFDKIFDDKFVDGLEKRRDLLESRQFTIIAIQIPILVLLLLSLLDLDFPITILGVTPHSSKSIRELLVVISATLGLAVTNLDLEINEFKELMRAFFRQRSQMDKAAEYILRKRYRLGVVNMPAPGQLIIGTTQLIVGTMGVVATIVVAGALLTFVFALQICVLIDIYNSPSFSLFVSKITIVYVVACYTAAVVHWLFNHSFQPFQTYEDFERLKKLQAENPKEYDRIIKEIATPYYKKSRLLRWLTRPKMKRLPQG